MSDKDHPSDIDPSLLVGDGGSHYFRKVRYGLLCGLRWYGIEWNLCNGVSLPNHSKGKESTKDNAATKTRNGAKIKTDHEEHEPQDDVAPVQKMEKHDTKGSAPLSKKASDEVSERTAFLYQHKPSQSKNTENTSNEANERRNNDDKGTSTKRPTSQSNNAYVTTSNQEQLNELSAKLFQAKFRNDTTLIQQLQQQVP
ncbi:hypothetical protein RFI_12143, partial [Reticulomyxa filosa]